MQVNEKIFEVEQIACRREHQGKEEFLVYWKGFDLSSATWEPVENLLSCKDLIEQYQRQANPIPGANPFKLIHSEKTKTVHVKMLLSRKNKQKRTKSMADLNDYDEVCSALSEDLKNHSVPNGFHKKKLSESEKLLRDTLLHESKSMTREKTSLDKINGILSYYGDPIKLNGAVNSVGGKRSLNRTVRIRDTQQEDLVLHTIRKNYMKITLNNVERHNVLTIGMLESICDCLMKAKKNNEVKAVLLSNNGDYFCSGIDYSELMNCADDKEYKSLVHELIACIRHFLGVVLRFSKPIVCAVSGPAIEFGVALVVTSDFAYANSKANFELLYSKLGLTPIGCLTQLLPRVVGNSMANSMFYIGGRYSAVSASDRGLILDMYGINSFQEDMEKKMGQLTVNSAQTLESTKKLVKHFESARLEEICEEELRVYQQNLCGKEARIKLKEDWTMLLNLYGDI